MNALELDGVKANARNNVEEAIQELAWLITQVDFSKRDYAIAGVDADLINRWTLGLKLLVND